MRYAENNECDHKGVLKMNGDMTYTLIMIIILIAVFYLFMIRPESKRKKQQEEMRSNLRKGDEITTIGGVVGRVVKIEDNTIIIETSEDRVRMEFAKWAVSTVGVQKSIEDTNNNKKNRKKQTPEERAESFSLEDTASEEANKE